MRFKREGRSRRSERQLVEHEWAKEGVYDEHGRAV